MTLKQGVQNLLKHYVKEVNSVEAYNMKKKLSYRDKLLELAKFIMLKKFKNIKNKKNLTTGQLELILKKINSIQKILNNLLKKIY